MFTMEITIISVAYETKNLSPEKIKKTSFATWRDVTWRDETRRLVTKHTNRALRQRQRENRYWESEYSICFNLPRRCNKYRGLKGKWSKMLFLLPNEIVLIMTRLAQRIFCRRGGGTGYFTLFDFFSQFIVPRPSLKKEVKVRFVCDILKRWEGQYLPEPPSLYADDSKTQQNFVVSNTATCLVLSYETSVVSGPVLRPSQVLYYARLWACPTPVPGPVLRRAGIWPCPAPVSGPVLRPSQVLS